jgi:hypothetical protein
MSQAHIPQSPPQPSPHMACPVCGDVMILAVLEPGREGQDHLTFACRGCKHTIARQEGRPTTLRYRVLEDGDGWRWEVVAQDGRVIAHGTEGHRGAATTAAVLQGMRSLQDATAAETPQAFRIDR